MAQTLNAGSVVVTVEAADKNALKTLARLQQRLDEVNRTVSASTMQAGAAVRSSQHINAAIAAGLDTVYNASTALGQMGQIGVKVGKNIAMAGDEAAVSVREVAYEAQQLANNIQKTRLDLWLNQSIRGQEEATAAWQAARTAATANTTAQVSMYQRITDALNRYVQNVQTKTQRVTQLQQRNANRMQQVQTQAYNALYNASNSYQRRVMTATQTVSRLWGRVAGNMRQAALATTIAVQPLVNAGVSIGAAFKTGANQAIGALGRLKTSLVGTGNAAQVLGGKSNKGALAVTQLGYAAEDAITVYGHMGLAGALRAAGNNLSFLASMMNPYAGLVVGVSIAVAALVYQFSQMEEKADDALRKLTAWLFDLRRDARSTLRDIEEELEDLSLGGGIQVQQADDTPVDRFTQNEKEFQEAIRVATRARERAGKELSEALALAAPGQGAAIDTNVGIWRDFKLKAGFETPIAEQQQSFELFRKSLAQFRNDVQGGLLEQDGGLEKLEEHYTNVFAIAKQLADQTGREIEDVLPEGFQDLAQEIQKSMKTAIVSDATINEYNKRLEEVAKNREEAFRLAEEDLVAKLTEHLPTTQMAELVNQQEELNILRQRDLLTAEQHAALLEENIKRQQEVQDQMDPNLGAARRWAESFKTPLEEAQDQIKIINRAFEEGFIDQDKYNRALDEVEDRFRSQMEEPLNIQVNFHGIDAIGFGSADMWGLLGGTADQRLLDQQRAEMEASMNEQLWGGGGRPQLGDKGNGGLADNNERDTNRQLVKTNTQLNDSTNRLVEALNRENTGLGLV